MDNVRERISRVVAEHFHVPRERVTELATLDEDLGATSLDHVEVVMTLEDEFAIDISDDQASRLHTVADVVACVTESIGRSKGTPARR